MKSKKYVVAACLLIILALLTVFRVSFCQRGSRSSVMFDSTQNISLLGDAKHAYFSSSIAQNADNSLIITSAVTDRYNQGRISVIKLSDAGSLEWETIFSLTGESLPSRITDFFRGSSAGTRNIVHGVASLNDLIYILVSREVRDLREPYLLTVDAGGKLIESQKLDIEIERDAELITAVRDKSIWVAYLNTKDKLLCLRRIDLADASVRTTAMLFYKQKAISLNAIAVHEADSIASITAYDKEKGCSYYRYSPQFGLKELFRTNPRSDITVLGYFESKLYAVVREDTTMSILDLSVYDKPLIPETDELPHPYFRATGLLVENDAFYVTVETATDNEQDTPINIEIRKYGRLNDSMSSQMIGNTLRQEAMGLFRTKGSSLLLVGRILDRGNNYGPKIFTTEVRF